MDDNNLNYFHENENEITIENINDMLNELSINFYVVDGKPFETKNEIIDFYNRRKNLFLNTKFLVQKKDKADWLKIGDDGVIKWTPLKINKSSWDWESIDMVLADLKEKYPSEKFIFKEKRILKNIWIFSIIFGFILLILIALLLVLLI
ncbi:MAG: hypothetical protein HPAVJP_3360 [Candidatus Hepatoplasma vulgare]|nr:MAG: hypothetical protein HPAVJP_3360 [Candidatus Hepatoplasma sp.]